MTILKQCRSCIYAKITWGKVYCNYGATDAIDVLIYNGQKECGHKENTILGNQVTKEGIDERDSLFHEIWEGISNIIKIYDL